MAATRQTRSLLQWLDAPAVDRGVNFACRGDQWDTWSYRDLANRCRAVAAGLASRGVRAGDVIGLALRTGPDFVASFFGALQVGAVPCPIATARALGGNDELYTHIERVVQLTGMPLLVVDGVIGSVDAPCSLVMAGDLAGDGIFSGSDAAPGPLALLQLTSGSSGPVKAVRVPFSALEANVHAIAGWLRWTRDDPVVSWLPFFHDMGLIGCLVTPVVMQSDLWLFSPDDFVRSPLRYLRCLAERDARLTAMPDFGLRYIVDSVEPHELEGLRFDGIRAVIVGAEQLREQSFAAFDELLAPHGLRPSALRPAFGLAEATLAVTGSPCGRRWRTVDVDLGAVALGRRVPLVERGTEVRSGRPVMGCGEPLEAISVSIVDGDEDRVLPEGFLGEIEVAGPSVAAGYLGGVGGSQTRFDRDRLRTGDAGFILDGELFVVGRLGDALRVRGRALFAEDLEAEVMAVAGGRRRRRLALVAGEYGGSPTVVLVVEGLLRDRAIDDATSVLRRRTEGAKVIVLTGVPRGTIERTSSGKVKRRALWRAFVEGALSGSHEMEDCCDCSR